VLTPPQHGSVSALVASGAESVTCVYTPANSYHGPDSFTFWVNDGTTSSVAATFSLTVIDNSVPHALAQSGLTTNENTGLALTLSASDTGRRFGDVDRGDSAGAWEPQQSDQVWG